MVKKRYREQEKVEKHCFRVWTCLWIVVVVGRARGIFVEKTNLLKLFTLLNLSKHLMDTVSFRDLDLR